MSTQSAHSGFGPNEWLVEEMYERYLADPESVDAAWHEFFADYDPSGPSSTPSDGDRAAVRPVGGDGVRGRVRPVGRPGAGRRLGGQRDRRSTRGRPRQRDRDHARLPAPARPRAAAPAAPRPPPRRGPLRRPAPPPPPSPRRRPSPAESGAARQARRAGQARRVRRAGQARRVRRAGQARRAGAEPAPAERKSEPAADKPTPLRGAAARVVANMETSLTVPTATSVRAVPAKLLADNRIVVNNHLRRARGGKVSFTHLIGYALVKALQTHPEMNNSFAEVDGRPALATPEHVNLGLAIDLQAKNGSRILVVASLKAAETLDFAHFLAAYEDIIRRARQGKLTTEDFAGTTISLTNPGTIGTVHSVPRLMAGQGTIIGVGAMEYPAAFAGMSEEALAQNAVSRTITLTSTYDHRIIQGAQSGEFLKRMHELLLGADDFYDEIFRSLRVPYEPVRWVQDQVFSHEGQIDKGARVIELINAYRTNGHLMADTDPLEFKIRSHPDLDIIKHGLTLWDLDREFPVGGFAGERVMKLRDILGVLRDAYCRRVGVEYMHITDPEERVWLQERIELKHEQVDREEQKHVLGRLNAAEAFETFLQTKYVGQRRFSLEGAESVIPLLDAVLTRAAEQELDEVVIGMPHRGRLNVLANIVGKSYGKIFAEFEGNIDPKSSHGSGDVKYHLGADGTFTSRSGADDPGGADRQPEPPGGRRPGGRGHRPGQAGPHRQGRGRLHRAAGADARRRRLRRPGRRRRDAQPVPAARLPHRRHRARGRQQPGRLHHLAGRGPVQPLLDRRGPDDPGADLPRERGRPRGVRAGGQAGRRLSPGVQEGRRHRHGVLPAARPQRDRQPVVHPAADVRHHRQEALGPEALHRGADRPRRHHAGGGRGGAPRLPGAARAGLRRDPGRLRAADGAGPGHDRRRRRRGRWTRRSPPR